MTTEFLKGLGLEQGVIDSIMSEKGKEVSALQAKYGDYDDVKKQLADANKQISAFKDMDIDGIKKAADDWKTKAETAGADANKKIAEMQFGLHWRRRSRRQKPNNSFMGAQKKWQITGHREGSTAKSGNVKEQSAS